MTRSKGTAGLSRLAINGFRHLSTTTVEPSPRLNVIYGHNAAGKTSVLEAIHFLARARSFLTTRTARLVTRSGDSVTVHGRINTADAVHGLGVQYQDGQTRVRLNGVDVQTLSESAWLLPIQVINTEAQRLLTDGPPVRRAFINWGVFHVEPTYRDHWRRYQRALRQRNSALRSGDARLAAAWEPEMAAAAEAVEASRHGFLATLMPRAVALASQWLGEDRLDWRYRRGWTRDTPLAEVFAAARPRKMVQGFSLYAPQLADLLFLVDGVEASACLSRGQQKLLVAGLRLALAEQWGGAGEQRPLVLVDDLPAELDAEHRQQLLTQLQATGAQLFVTTIEREQVPAMADAEWFHVEQGMIAPV